MTIPLCASAPTPSCDTDSCSTTSMVCDKAFNCAIIYACCLTIYVVSDQTCFFVWVSCSMLSRCWQIWGRAYYSEIYDWLELW